LLDFMTTKQFTFLHQLGIIDYCAVLIARANHFGVFRDSGLEVKQYRYYDKKNISLDLEGMLEDIKVLSSWLFHL